MFFYLDYSHTQNAGALPRKQLAPGATDCPDANVLYLQEGAQRLVSVPTPDGELLLLGDPVVEPGTNLGKELCPGGKLDENALYQAVRGHYYWFLMEPDGLSCGSSFCAIFPIYYARQNERIQICSASFFLAKKTKANQPDRRNLLERLLFNYPFFNSTWWEEISLLEAHRRLVLKDGKISFGRHFQIEQQFGSGAGKSQQDLEGLVDLFAEESRLFLPDAPFAISFTGGFDGRTLLAAARKAGKTDFLSYSFGHPAATDVTFPQAQARKIGLPYRAILLDEQYLNEHALASAQEFMRLTEYNGNYGRPHYHYAAQLLAKEVDYLITGNFGSEMFRALHQPGVMMSASLIDIFATTDHRWKDRLRQTTPGWSKGFFRQELDVLIADLEQYLAPMRSWDANQRFYYFVFNEIFRKYFGPELVMQSHFFNNRTPFLSLRFFRELNNTIWSGVHTRLFEKQKNKRLKGQQFYSAFIRKTDPQLYRLPTNKGYRPADVLEPWRLPLLLGGVAWQKFVHREEPDSNSVDAFFQRYQQQILSQIMPDTDTVLQGAGLAARLHQGGNNQEDTIKYYSIAAGWEAAKAKTKQKQPSTFTLKYSKV